MIFLVLVNLVVILVSLAIFLSLNQDYKKLYLLGFVLTLIILSVFSIIKYGVVNLTFVDGAMILYRGGLILAFFGGALGCFIASKLAQKND